MDIMEIILLIAGVVVVALSFFIPDKKAADVDVKGLTEDEVKGIVGQEVTSLEDRVADLMEKTERSMEKLSNEKIMAVDEYSDTVLAQIHKNHEEAVFLYDMLNNKQASLKNALSEINRTLKETREAAATLEKLNHISDAPNLASTRNAEKGPDSTESSEPEMRAEGTMEEKPGLHGVQSAQGTEGDGRNKNEKILELCRQGKDATAIARELGLGVGEVKLVIDLFQG